MPDARLVEPQLVHAAGTLIFKDYAYALRTDDGADIWLDMDCSPSHLIDRPVHVDGDLRGGRVITVRGIGPLS